MPDFTKGNVTIHYEERGAGFPLLLLPGGGLNATIPYAREAGPFDSMASFSDAYRCVAADLRNANGGGSHGPVDVERTWDAFTDDQLALMDHLGVKRFLVLGFCIGGPMIWNLIKRAPERVVAAVIVQPSGHRVEKPTQFYDNNLAGWGPAICARRPDVTMATVEAFLTNMYTKRADFVFTVDRDFVRNCHTPVMVLPDDVPAHPYAVAVESAMLSPNAQLSMYPWKDVPERIPLAVRHIRTFLDAHRLAEGR